MNSKTLSPAAETRDDPTAGAAGLRSVALTRCLQGGRLPDHVDVVAVAVPADAPQDPGWYARRLFALSGLPRWVAVLLTARQLLVPLLGVRPSPADVLRVREVIDGEAVIEASERHLDFWLAVAVDPRGVEPRFVRATTVVRLHGWRGRLYWSVVQVFHGPVTQTLLRRTVRRAARGRGPGRASAGAPVAGSRE